MKLILGVNDVAYKDDKKMTTTGQVAQYLEDDYHVMRTFLELNEAKIGDALVDSLAGSIESLSEGKPASFDVAGPMQRIEEAFRDFLDAGHWELVSGQKIEAAERGVSHRRKHPYQKRKKRTPFVDTGEYQASFRAWLAD